MNRRSSQSGWAYYAVFIPIAAIFLEPAVVSLYPASDHKRRAIAVAILMLVALVVSFAIAFWANRSAIARIISRDR